MTSAKPSELFTKLAAILGFIIGLFAAMHFFAVVCAVMDLRSRRARLLRLMAPGSVGFFREGGGAEGSWLWDFSRRGGAERGSAAAGNDGSDELRGRKPGAAHHHSSRTDQNPPRGKGLGTISGGAQGGGAPSPETSFRSSPASKHVSGLLEDTSMKTHALSNQNMITDGLAGGGGAAPLRGSFVEFCSIIGIPASR